MIDILGDMRKALEILERNQEALDQNPPEMTFFGTRSQVEYWEKEFPGIRAKVVEGLQ